jgi:hypothetical protein
LKDCFEGIKFVLYAQFIIFPTDKAGVDRSVARPSAFGKALLAAWFKLKSSRANFWLRGNAYNVQVLIKFPEALVMGSRPRCIVRSKFFGLPF